ncbi:Crp/Fnr family transcriptional regulator [Belliella marina]|uniref:Crp/Fnr family transcriptional regulator n=1 Tax=Belliella marina TaxID=1644146 RepID=A0ABW4VTJ8_9BACT
MTKNKSILYKAFGQYSDLSGAVMEQFEEIMVERLFARGELLVREGDLCDRLFFIEQGVVRSYHYREVKDVTISFAQSGDFTTSMSGFVTGKPSYEYIEALEDTTVLELGRGQLLKLFEVAPQCGDVYRQMLEAYYVRLEEHFIFSKFKTAKERYFELIEGNPQIIRSATIGQIASYLGISIETLSRIRAGR